jgi:hypothetical protein
LGAGPETFAVEFRKIESVAMSRAYPDFYHETPHNALIDAADAQGFPWLLILLAVFALGFAAANRGIRAALAGIFVASLFASFTLVEAMYLWIFVIIAIVAETPVHAAIKPTPRLTLLPAARCRQSACLHCGIGQRLRRRHRRLPHLAILVVRSSRL